MKLRKYRIVRDNFEGNQCQEWCLWYPFWIEMNGISGNSYENFHEAVAYIENNKKVVWESK